MGLAEKMSIGLQLTVYGTGLVFLVLAFLWGLMSVLLRLDREKKVAREEDTPRAPAPDLTPQERAAITLAVLAHRGMVKRISRAREKVGRRIPAPSEWVMLGRARQLRRVQR